jgi:phage shock protein A
MLQMVKKWWKYLTAKAHSDFEAKADPKIQLEQAIAEAQQQHKVLVERAADVIANQKQAELRLNRALEDLEKANGSTRQALLLTDEANRNGDATKTAEYNQAAEGFAQRLISLEAQVDEQKTTLLEATTNAANAKVAVTQNSALLQQKLRERQKLLSQLDQAKMQEQMNTAMAQLTASVGDDVPTFEQVRDKIEARLAKAQGMSELTQSPVNGRMLEVEQAQMNAEAQARLSQLRSELGLTSPTAPVPAPGEPAAGTEGPAVGSAG